jgi:hypothetical protein
MDVANSVLDTNLFHPWDNEASFPYYWADNLVRQDFHMARCKVTRLELASFNSHNLDNSLVSSHILLEFRFFHVFRNQIHLHLGFAFHIISQ